MPSRPPANDLTNRVYIHLHIECPRFLIHPYHGGPQPYLIPTMEYMDLLVAFLSVVVMVSLLVRGMQLTTTII
ncbi:hypothetical protein HanXRQr2_Chr10g0434911 [Helianthus annuus]|uniref:Uncharacterized protein n=1 Tax=Helianthus annuus TaxID=4232 RepID=A0A9K3HXC0_HELAN|nr:hypothetical protein HanXRQr2_Chr10g0434911 [Helianthus annuus]KAJ0513428.1 hypothetical protein HanHA300_Chr10g0357461 [Helianthus annuus]KAJ0529543.1 hypothetical protein HanHA89_Chr10g0379071 [Helianthus annuus]KAJ0696428.1 hypothetical protein HanLR1_Chr10g0356971 [Helianthus annuus]